MGAFVLRLAHQKKVGKDLNRVGMIIFILYMSNVFLSIYNIGPFMLAHLHGHNTSVFIFLN